MISFNQLKLAFYNENQYIQHHYYYYYIRNTKQQAKLAFSIINCNHSAVKDDMSRSFATRADTDIPRIEI